MSDMDLGIPSDAEDEDPDWLKGLGEDEGFAEPDSAGEDSLDWQDSAEGDQDEAEAAPLQKDAATEKPESLAESQADDSPVIDSARDEQESTDWLTNIRAAEAENAPKEDQSDASKSPDEEGELPDWLNQVRASEAERLGEEDSSSQEEDFMERIQSMGTSEGAGVSGASDPDSPDWLSGLLSEPEPTESEPEQIRPEEDLSPDGLSGMDDESPTDTEQVSPEALQSEQVVEETESDSPSLPNESGFVNTGSLPSWLVAMKRTGSLEIADDAAGAAASSGEGDDFDRASEEQMPVFDLSPGDLPDWISESSSDLEYPDEEEFDTQKQYTDGPTEAENETPEAPGDMPSWLYSMRPVASPDETKPVEMVEDSEGVEETVGPLAGLLDIIPAEPEIAQFGKPPAYSYNLQVTDSQQHNASLFERLMAAESMPKKTTARVAALTQGALRWTIAGLLIVSLLVPILTQSNSIEFLDIETTPAETTLLQGLVSNLDQGKPILVSFDYQPGFSGEMHAAAAAVFDDLLLQGAQLVIVSTQPTGAALADTFLAQTQAEKHLYVENIEYRNLGYLAGGISGLLGLAKNPRLSLPVGILVGNTLQNVWAIAPLTNINGLGDFGMVLVLTDDPDIARAWVEQIKPSLGDTPLTMILSAQAEPLVRPYFESDPKQIQGYVTGVLGGTYYENYLSRDNVARTYWNSYSTGLGVAVLLIFVGSLASLANALLLRRKTSREESG